MSTDVQNKPQYITLYILYDNSIVLLNKYQKTEYIIT